MSTHRYAIPVETTQWHIPNTTEATFNWEYDEGRDRLLNLYEKGKDKQWNAQTRIDWSVDIDFDDPSLFPDELVPIYGSQIWEDLSRERKNEVRHHIGAWLNSQFLHGEQGALICSAKIVESVPDVDSKFYAATQVMDEARHVEAYEKYLNDKLELAYPINPHLQTLLDQTISDSRWDLTYLGMQVMIEGVALAAFSLIRDLTQEPLGRSLTAYVMQDEARHVAFGRLALKDAYAELTEAERKEREEFVVEATYLLRDRFLAEEVWETLGLPVSECVQYVDRHQTMTEFRKALFSRIVPCVSDIGLMGDQVTEHYEKLGILGFQHMDLDELADNDERIAEEMDRALAGGNGSGRGAEIAGTVVAGNE